MPTDQKATDSDKARKQDTANREGAAERGRTPLLAALGAGDLATRTVMDALSVIRTQLQQGADSARSGVNELPREFNQLRGRLDPAELRKLVDTYSRSAVQFYGYLADRGEDTLGRLRSQPQVQQAWSQFESAQERVGEAVEDARGLADDVLGRVSRTSRSFGERTARTTEKATGDAARTAENVAGGTAESVREAGSRTAGTTRSTSQKAANRAESAQSTNGARSSESQKGSDGAKSGDSGPKQAKQASRKGSGS